MQRGNKSGNEELLAPYGYVEPMNRDANTAGTLDITDGIASTVASIMKTNCHCAREEWAQGAQRENSAHAAAIFHFQHNNTPKISRAIGYCLLISYALLAAAKKNASANTRRLAVLSPLVMSILLEPAPCATTTTCYPCTVLRGVLLRCI